MIGNGREHLKEEAVQMCCDEKLFVRSNGKTVEGSGGKVVLCGWANFV
jgi:hypothetical protein